MGSHKFGNELKRKPFLIFFYLNFNYILEKHYGMKNYMHIGIINENFNLLYKKKITVNKISWNTENL